MRATIEIRRAVVTDAEALAELRFEFRAALGEIAEARPAFVARAAGWMRRRLGDGSAWRCWLAESAGAAPLANLWLQVLEKIPNPVAETEWHGYLSNFYVRPEWRGGGLGTMLLGETLAEARRLDLDRVVLWPTARSRPLYERHGFAPSANLLELKLRPDGPPDPRHG